MPIDQHRGVDLPARRDLQAPVPAFLRSLEGVDAIDLEHEGAEEGESSGDAGAEHRHALSRCGGPFQSGLALAVPGQACIAEVLSAPG